VRLLFAFMDAHESSSVFLPTAGNKRFRDLITSAIPDYDKAESRLEKSLVVHSIVEGIRSVGGRFLKADPAPGRWRGKFFYRSTLVNLLVRSDLFGASHRSTCRVVDAELDDRACREKVGHAVRDAATISQTRRQKKKDQLPQMNPSTSYVPQRGPISRNAETKMDTPDPISFHDFAFFSNYMSGPPSFSSSLRPLEPSASARLGGEQQRAMSAPTFLLPEPDPIIEQGHAGRTNQGTVAGSTRQDHLPGEEDFMAHIAEVLGPMPINHSKDPLAEILELS
jgi:hypothetical protein